MFDGFLEKLKSKNSKKKISNGTNPHILHTLSIIYFFKLFKKIWDFIGYCLNLFITFREYSNDAQKNQDPKIFVTCIASFFFLFYSTTLTCAEMPLVQDWGYGTQKRIFGYQSMTPIWKLVFLVVIAVWYNWCFYSNMYGCRAKRYREIFFGHLYYDIIPYFLGFYK